MTTAMTAAHVPMLGVNVAALTLEGMLAQADRVIAERRRLLVGVVNAAKLVNMRRDPTLRAAVLAADVILADGVSVVWAARVLGRPLPERIAGIDLMVRLLERAHEQRYRVYCLGATEEVLGTLTRRMRRDYPGVRLVGARNGYFPVEEEPGIAAKIADAGADVLFVGMSSPRKELFLARWADTMGVPVCHGVGGSFDVLAGKVRRAPAGWQRLGLEWLYRVRQEPRRLWRRYLVTNTLFVGMVAAELARRGVRGGAAVAAGTGAGA